MRKIKSMMIATILLIAGTTISCAQVDESRLSNGHGGVIQASGSYNIEMVKQSDKITFYLLDSNKETITNKGVTGTVVFKFQDNSTLEIDLVNASTDKFIATSSKINSATTIDVTFKVKGKSVTSSFKTPLPVKIQIPQGHNHGEGGHQH